MNFDRLLCHYFHAKVAEIRRRFRTHTVSIRVILAEFSELTLYFLFPKELKFLPPFFSSFHGTKFLFFALTSGFLCTQLRQYLRGPPIKLPLNLCRGLHILL